MDTHFICNNQCRRTVYTVMILHPEQRSAESATGGITRRLAKAIGLLLLYAAVWLFLSMAIMLPWKLLFGETVDSMDAAAEMGYEGFLMLLAVVVINAVLFYRFKSTAAWAGWPGFRLGLGGFGNGALIGLGMSGSMFVLTVLMGGGYFSLDGSPWTEYLLRVVPLLFFVLISTLSEEALFRGYPMTILARATSPGWANLLMALVFSVMHASSAGFNGLVAFNVVIGSLVVGALRFTRGGIPAAWGFHFAWNGLQVVAGSSLTGLDMEVPALHFAGKGQDWLSGGALGPEGGIGAMLSTLIVLIILTLYFRRRGTADLPLPLGRSSRESQPLPDRD